MNTVGSVRPHHFLDAKSKTHWLTFPYYWIFRSNLDIWSQLATTWPEWRISLIEHHIQFDFFWDLICNSDLISWKKTKNIKQWGGWIIWPRKLIKNCWMKISLNWKWLPRNSSIMLRNYVGLDLGLLFSNVFPLLLQYEHLILTWYSTWVCAFRCL